MTDWRKEAPTEPGWYWLRFAGKEPMMVRVRYDMMVRDSLTLADEWTPIAAVAVGEWLPCVPFSPEAVARAAIAECVALAIKAHNEHSDAIDEMRALDPAGIVRGVK